jgi:CHAT domain-containing protein/AAA ATPase-like protein
MMPDRVIQLSISESGSGSAAVFSFHLHLDGDVAASNQGLTVPQSQAVRELSTRYGSLFEQRRLPQLAREELTAIGAQLFELWLAPSWQSLSPKLGLGDLRTLVIASDRASVLNLPWELLRPASGEAIGADARWGLRRLPWADRRLEGADGGLTAGPLRVLYMVSAPTDQVELDFEREEELLLSALGRAGRRVVFDSGDLGSFEELGERINEFRPHIVHLTGHGVTREETAYFAFEDDRGESDDRSASEVGQLFAGSGVACAFLSACQASRAPTRAALGGLAQGLLAEGVPLVIGWTASILDDVATQVASSFYGAVSPGQTTVDRALVVARQAARRVCEPRGDPSWSLPVLYASTGQMRLFDAARTEPSPRPSLVLERLPGMVGGHTPHFIGRRRELQRLLPGLRGGELQAVVLTGLGGSGKSTLATRLARKLETDGLTPLALSSSAETPLSAGQLLETCGQAFLDAGQRDIHATLRDPTLPVADRLRTLVTGLNRGRFVLVLDNFESNLDEGSRQILDSELAGFYRHLLGNLVGGSRLIVTSRYLPADAPRLPATATELQLGEFREAAFLKFLLRDGDVERRYRAGELPHHLLVRLHRVLGATPRFLEQIRTVLASLPGGELRDELDRVALPSEAEEQAEPGRLQAARDAYCETIFTERLYGRLPPEAQRVLSQAAVYGLAVTLEGLAAVAGGPGRGGAGGGGAVAYSGAGVRGCRWRSGVVVGLRHAARLAARASGRGGAAGGAYCSGRLPRRARPAGPGGRAGRKLGGVSAGGTRAVSRGGCIG